MSFMVDKIFEDSFHINMLLGLPQFLDRKSKLGVAGRRLTRNPPCLHADICSWEQRNSVLLPEDLRSFYTSTDGVLFEWLYNSGRDSTFLTAKIEVNPLAELTQIFGYETFPEPGVNMENVQYQLKLGVNSKIFDLAPIETKGKVLLVYINPRFAPTIWFTDSKNFWFLADDFTTYFKMSLAHLGIPYWPFRFAPQGLPQWSENLFRIMAPHLLPFNKCVESIRKQCTKKSEEDYKDIEINKLDPNVFNCFSNKVPVVSEEKCCLATKLPKSRKKQEKEKIVTKFQRKPLYVKKSK